MSNAKKSFVIGDHFDGFIEEQVKSGRFNNASEVVRAGLRLLERDEAKLAELKRLIKEGEDDIAAGRVLSFSSAEELTDYIIKTAADRQ
jgi:antitoxin ParD1/3/4